MKNEILFSEIFTSHIWPYFIINADYSAHAKENIYSSLKKLSSFAQKDPLDILEEDAVQFMIQLEKKASIQDANKYSSTYIMTIYRQLRAFYKFLFANKIYLNAIYQTEISRNPFAEVYCNFSDREIVTIEDIPSIKEIDLLLSNISNPSLSLAVKLSLKMGFTASEIIGLTKRQFIENKGETYIEMIDKPKKGAPRSRILHVPADLMDELNRVVSFYPDTEEIIIMNLGCNENHVYQPKAYTLRTIQRHLQQCCDNAQLRSITFSDLRNFFIFHAKLSGIPENEIADFTNQEGRWIRRFELISTENIHHAADYINLYFK